MDSNSEPFELETFFPYLVRLFYRTVNAEIASVYKDDYGLSVQEWRIMAILGQTRKMTAKDIANHSSMDKVVVSRAIKRLEKKGLIAQQPHPADGRQSMLSLRDSGGSIFQELIPKLREKEEELLQPLSADERETLTALMARIRQPVEK